MSFFSSFPEFTQGGQNYPSFFSSFSNVFLSTDAPLVLIPITSRQTRINAYILFNVIYIITFLYQWWQVQYLEHVYSYLYIFIDTLHSFWFLLINNENRSYYLLYLKMKCHSVYALASGHALNFIIILLAFYNIFVFHGSSLKECKFSDFKCALLQKIFKQQSKLCLLVLTITLHTSKTGVAGLS